MKGPGQREGVGMELQGFRTRARAFAQHFDLE